MSTVGQRERAKKNRVVGFAQQALEYDYLALGWAESPRKKLYLPNM